MGYLHGKFEGGVSLPNCGSPSHASRLQGLVRRGDYADWDKLPCDRHSQQINCDFEDGHAERLKKINQWDNGSHSPYYSGL